MTSSFHDTRWTLVSRSRGSDTQAAAALSELCEAYYAPVVTFIMRNGFDEPRSRDLAHSFFARLLSSPEVLKPDRARGRFRSYLLGAVKHFVSDTLDQERALKRGGGNQITHLTETGMNLPEDTSLSPDRAFDRQWATGLLNRVRARLEAALRERGQEKLCTLLPLAAREDDTTRYVDIGAALEVMVTAIESLAKAHG